MTFAESLQPVLDKRLPAALVAALFLSTPASAQEHLMPGAETVEGYETSVTHALRGAFGDDVHVNAFVEPSFQQEFAVGTKQDGDIWRIFYLHVIEPVWPKLLEKKDTAQIGSEGCEIEIGPELGKRIDTVWDTMLRQIHDGEKYPQVLDGSFYYFSKVIDGRLRIGMATDADVNTKPGKLQSVVYGMRDLCTKRDDASRANLNQRVDSLLVQLGHQDRPSDRKE